MENLVQEVAFIAYHYHWAKDEIMEMSHRERHLWVKEISRINDQVNQTSETNSKYL